MYIPKVYFNKKGTVQGIVSYLNLNCIPTEIYQWSTLNSVYYIEMVMY